MRAAVAGAATRVTGVIAITEVSWVSATIAVAGVSATIAVAGVLARTVVAGVIGVTARQRARSRVGSHVSGAPAAASVASLRSARFIFS